jgi:hypothetical protein
MSEERSLTIVTQDFGHNYRERPYVPHRYDSQDQTLYPLLAHIIDEIRKDPWYQQFIANANSATGNPGVGLGASRELVERVTIISERMGFKLASLEQDQILAYLEKDTKPFGLIQELVDDENISDIIVSGCNSVTIQQGRRNYATRITFPTQAYYEAFVERLLTRAKTTYSTKQPIADGMIGALATDSCCT